MQELEGHRDLTRDATQEEIDSLLHEFADISDSLVIEFYRCRRAVRTIRHYNNLA